MTTIGKIEIKEKVTDGNLRIPSEKMNELYHDFYIIKAKITTMCMGIRDLSYVAIYSKNEKKIAVDGLLPNADHTEVALIKYTAAICACLRGTHYICKKGYVYKEGFVRFYIIPDWEYFWGESTYLHKNYKVPTPEEIMAKHTVIISVRGGVAEVVHCPEGIGVEIIDYDNINAEAEHG